MGYDSVICYCLGYDLVRMRPCHSGSLLIDTARCLLEIIPLGPPGMAFKLAVAWYLIFAFLLRADHLASETPRANLGI